MDISNALFDQLANLARLEFSESERENLKKDLQEILKFIEQINEVDTTNVEPLIHISEAQNVFRKDKAQNNLTTEEALKNAPLRKKDFFAVPKVINK